MVKIVLEQQIMKGQRDGEGRGGDGIGVEVSLYYFFRVGNATPRPLYSQERDPVTIV
jgi:hypothetical protein